MSQQQKRRGRPAKRTPTPLSLEDREINQAYRQRLYADREAERERARSAKVSLPKLKFMEEDR